MAKKQVKNAHPAPRKAGRKPLDPQGSTPVTAKVPTPLAVKLEKWAAKQSPPLNRSQAVTEAIRRLVD